MRGDQIETDASFLHCSLHVVVDLFFSFLFPGGGDCLFFAWPLLVVLRQALSCQLFLLQSFLLTS